MLKIEQIYNQLPSEEEVIFQVKTKKTFIEIIHEMRKVVKEWDWIWVEDSLDYKSTYFILGNWRGGMFELRNKKGWDCDERIHILADYKEMPIEYQEHLKQINELIKIMDKYRNNIIKKRLKFDCEFNIVEKVGDE